MYPKFIELIGLYWSSYLPYISSYLYTPHRLSWDKVRFNSLNHEFIGRLERWVPRETLQVYYVKTGQVDASSDLFAAFVLILLLPSEFHLLELDYVMPMTPLLLQISVSRNYWGANYFCN